MRDRDIIIKPILSEKSYSGIADKKYTFVVAKDANKTEIKLAIERIFGVSVERVNTVNCHGKLLSGLLVVISSKVLTVIPRRAGEVGLYLLIPILKSS